VIHPSEVILSLCKGMLYCQDDGSGKLGSLLETVCSSYAEGTMLRINGMSTGVPNGLPLTYKAMWYDHGPSQAQVLSAEQVDRLLKYLDTVIRALEVIEDALLGERTAV
jgi:hypothetical protein